MSTTKYYPERGAPKSPWQARILAELRRIQKIRKKNDDRVLYGVEQALGWAMRGNFMMPSKLWRTRK